VFSSGQLAAVRAVFALTGYEGELRTLPVDSEDERIFVLDQAVVTGMDIRSLEQVLQQLLGRKVWVLTSVGNPTVPFE
jgi:hypothetical protein